MPHRPTWWALPALALTLVLAALGGTAQAATVTPSADGYVREDQASTNFGYASTLRVDGSPYSKAYLRFRVNEGGAPITRATLRLFPKSTITNSGVAVRPVTSGTWTEGGLTYRNAPLVGASAGSSGGPLPAGQWISVDVTSLVRGDGDVNLAVTTGSMTSRTFASREDAAYAPRLVVETSASSPTPPTSPAPAPDPGTGGVPFRGAQSHGLWSSSPLDVSMRELDMLKSAGATSVRFDVAWSSLETSAKGSYSSWYVDKIDTLFAAAAARGMKVVAALHTTPCWASSAPDTLKQSCSGSWWDRNVQNYPPRDARDYADAASYVAKRWGGYLAALEIWNEPNEAAQTFLVSPDPAADYARIVKAAYGPVKAVQPSLPVIAGATSFADRAFIERLYSLGIAPYEDGISIHPYSESRSPWETGSAGQEKWNFKSGVPWVRDAMVANGDGAKGLWLTEYGWSTCTVGSSKWCVSTSQQAQFVADSFKVVRDSGWGYVKAMLVYNLRNKGTDPLDREAQFGLLNRDFSPKPGWNAFANALTTG